MKPTFDYSSVFKIGSHGLVSLVVSGFIANVALAAPASNALPTGGAVVSGNVAIATNAATMNINQASSKSVINWQTYNIGSAATVNYNFAQAGSSSLNRVLSNNPSEIYGRLNANGKVILVNPNGIVFGSGSSVNVGSLVATTMNIKDADYLNDKLVFTRDGSIGKILSDGTITAEDKGYIALLAPEVVNKGVIKAVMGTVSMAAGDKIELALDDSGLKTVILEPSTIKTLIDNKALIEAKGGVVYLGAKEANAILDETMNLKNSGIVEATAMNSVNGKIILDGDNIEVDGTLKATEVYAGNKNNAKTLIKATASLEGEFVETSGKVLAVENGANIKAKKWLLDPTDVTIDSGSGAIGGVTVGASVIQTALNGGTDVSLQADNDINVNSNISWSSNILTLTAGNDINVNAVMTATSTAGIALNTGANGSINMAMNSDKSDFIGKINIASTGSAAINGDAYTIISDRASLEKIGTGFTGVTGFDTEKTSLAGRYILGSDIDLSGGNWAPIGNGAYHYLDVNQYYLDYISTFGGSLDGFGHTVSHMTIASGSSSDYVNNQGLFGVVSNGNISNLAVTNASIAISGMGGSNIGIVAGQVGAENGTASIRNIITSGTITSTLSVGGAEASDIGGLVGSLYANYTSGDKAVVSNAHSDVEITGELSGNIGGLIGSIGSGTDYGVVVSNSSAKSTITSTYSNGESYGGFVGSVNGNGTDITSVVFDRVLSSTVLDAGISGQNVGGLIGEIQSGATIKESYALSEIKGGDYAVGGLVGYAGTVDIRRSFAKTDITANSDYEIDNIGGLVGSIGDSGTPSSITDSYATGTIKSDLSANTGGYVFGVGGLIGFAWNTNIDKSYTSVGIDIKMGNLDGNNWDQIYGVGGFAGEFDAVGSITNSAALGNVKVVTGNLTAGGGASIYASGFIGYLGTYGDSATISNNIAAGTLDITTGTVDASAKKFTGGFIGAYSGNSDDQATDNGDATIAGNKFVAADTLGSPTTVNPTALATYDSSGLTFDFTNTWALDASKNGGLPYLKWTSDMFGGSSGGSGGGSSGGSSSSGGSTTSNTTTTTNSPVEVVVSKIADNVVKNVEKTILAPQTITPVVIGNTSQVATTPSTVQVVQPTNTENPVAQGGAIINTGNSTQLSVAMVSDANPFTPNENISVVGGGVKIASAEISSEVKSDIKPSGIVGVIPPSMVVIRQFTPQKGVELALMAPSANTADTKVAAKITTDIGSGFNFTVKEAVSVNVAQKDIKEVKATLDNGQALPAWLQFDAKSQTFKAVNPPANALPISTKVSVTTKSGQTQQIAVEIAK